MTTLATYLKTKTESAGLNQGSLSRIMGYGSSQFCSNWFRNISLPPSQSLGKLSVALKVPLDELKAAYRTEYMARAEKTLAAKLEAVV